jgi:hypothetical protein
LDRLLTKSEITRLLGFNDGGKSAAIYRIGMREVMVNAVASMVRDVFTGETVVSKSKVVAQLLKYGRGLMNRRDADQLLSYDDRFMDLPGERGGRVMFRPHVKIERELCSVGCSLLTPYHSLIHPKPSLSAFPSELSLEPESIDKAYLQAQLKGEDISRDELIRSREQFRAAYKHVMEGKESLFHRGRCWGRKVVLPKGSQAGNRSHWQRSVCGGSHGPGESRKSGG